MGRRRGHGRDGEVYGAMGRAWEGWVRMVHGVMGRAREGWGGVWGDGEGTGGMG